MKYALSSRSRDPGEPARLIVEKRRNSCHTAPTSSIQNGKKILPCLKSQSIADHSLEAGDTIFSSSKSRSRKLQTSGCAGPVQLPRLMNNKSTNEDPDETLITIDQTQDSSHLMTAGGARGLASRRLNQSNMNMTHTSSVFNHDQQSSYMQLDS